MFNRKAVDALKATNENGDTPRPRFLRLRSVATANFPHPSPAKRLLSLIKSGITPSKKTPKMGWKSSTVKSPTANSKASIFMKEEASFYAQIVARKDVESLPSTVSPSSSLSPQSGLGITNLPGWAKATETEISDFGHRDNFSSPPPSRPPSSPSFPFSPVDSYTPRRSLFRRQASHSSLADIMMSPYHLDRSHDIDYSMQDISRNDLSQDISYDHYDYDLNHHYDFDQDDDLATERDRYLKGKILHIDGVEITAEEEEFTKSFNRIKLDRRPRRTNREEEDYAESFNRIKLDRRPRRGRKPKQSFALSGKTEEDIINIDDDMENLRL